MVRICAKGTSDKLPTWLSSAVKERSWGDRQYALVEFGTEAQAAKAVDGFNNPDNWCVAQACHMCIFLGWLAWG